MRLVSGDGVSILVYFLPRSEGGHSYQSNIPRLEFSSLKHSSFISFRLFSFHGRPSVLSFGPPVFFFSSSVDHS